MKYTVLWTRNAERRLAALWMAATDREAVATAANAIDVALRGNSPDCGESRSGDRRILNEPHLAVIFSRVRSGSKCDGAGRVAI